MPAADGATALGRNGRRRSWKTTWGIGFAIRRFEDMTVIGHGGGCPGYITNFSMVTEDKIATVVLTNAGDGPARNTAQNVLKIISAALEEAKTPSEESVPDLSLYEGNYEVSPWGGEVAVRQWGDQLVVIDIPSDDLGEAMIKLEHDSGHTFVRLTDDDEPRESWVFEMGDDGAAKRILKHSVYYNRIE